MTTSFDNHVVLVTGGTKGIGFSIAKAFSKAGARVLITGRNQPDFSPADEGFHGFYAFDIANAAETDARIAEILETHGRVDVLVNNAGLTRDTLFMRMNETMFDEVIDANLKGAFNVTRALSRQFMKNRKGSVINITSVVGQTGNMGQVNYSSSKAGLIGFTKSVALEFAPRGVRVNAIAPGFIQTRMTDSLTEDVKAEYLKRIPLGILGAPEDIAAAALFLASDAARYITGQVINVNGGMYMG